jgi:hypothetical protein
LVCNNTRFERSRLLQRSSTSEWLTGRRFKEQYAVVSMSLEFARAIYLNPIVTTIDGQDVMECARGLRTTLKIVLSTPQTSFPHTANVNKRNTQLEKQLENSLKSSLPGQETHHGIGFVIAPRFLWPTTVVEKLNFHWSPRTRELQPRGIK